MRLVTFGCSLTVGFGLDDVGVRPITTSKYSWPNVLGKLLSCDVVNCAVSGASNKEILWHIQNFNFQANDIVVILWSHKDRWCIHKDGLERINVWDDNTRSITYFAEYHDEYDMIVDMHTRIHYTHMYLNKKGIQNFHAYADTEYKHNFDWFDVTMLSVCMTKIRSMYPTAKYDHHPGIEAHDVFAQNIYSEIKEQI